ncbi:MULTISPECIES: dephospho-CoA kinase [Actinoplanes]|uniref:dephospho-CoA kinase n=1 Tax=Actinoplanes TaxID=1865 RepID=UPI000696C266|nr:MULTISPECIES: dephospho-CoA kinase [Actinoplanes]GLY07355.1 adenylate kinase [Actinoplanes sp. NBRC 101535]
MSADVWLADAVDRVLTWSADRQPSAGPRRVLAVEGRSGSGKTTLAGAVAARLDAPLIHMDDLYAGWDGLDRGVSELHDRVLAPLRDGRPAVWRRWDWAAGHYAEDHPVPDADWLVVEGVGAGARVLRAYTCGVVWVESPTAMRRRRALARDGATYQPHWERWARHEDAFYAAEQVRENATLIIENREPGNQP